MRLGYLAEFEQAVSKRNFEQKKRFLRSLPAGTISHFTSRIYPSLAEVSDANDFENAKSHAKEKPLLAAFVRFCFVPLLLS